MTTLEAHSDFSPQVFGLDFINAPGSPVAYIPLSSRDASLFAIVDSDPEVAALLAEYTWTAVYRGGEKFYAKASWCKRTKAHVRIYMHRLLAKHFIGDPPSAKSVVVDHINGNSLDNRLQNFRWLSGFDNRWRYARHK